jgi:hypothetical protein
MLPGSELKSLIMSKAKSCVPKVIIGDGTLSKAEQERLALLMILHLGERQIAEGKYVPLPVAMKRLRARLRERQAKRR